MKIKSLLIASAIIIFCTGFVSAQNRDTAVLQDLVRQAVAAQSAYDVPALEKLTTADYIEISPLGEFDPREKMLGFYKPELKQKGLEVKTDIDEFSVRSYDKFAIVIARLNYSMIMDGKPVPPRSMRATYVCRKEGGVWKIASAHFTSIRQQAPPQK
jgi:ketosteroid isomerase-like protein